MTNTNPINFGYYENDRPEIFLQIEPRMLSILDVGCGSGILGKNLKLNVLAANAAKVNLDEVVIGDIQTMSLPFSDTMFDCIIFADILEHLLEPTAVLEKLKPYLKPDGVIICSIPNMRHYAVIVKIIRSGWFYEDYGHFDRTHLRFFSLRSMKDLITNSGFNIESVLPKIAGSRKMKFLNFILFGKIEEFLAFQYIIKARKQLP
jgi:SAM-dependent methyltransferase